MSNFPEKIIIERDGFIETADRMLADAESPDSTISQSAELAGLVMAKLGEIASGTVEVRPALSQEQVEHYQKKASFTQSIAQKALGAIEAAAHTGGGRRGKKNRGRPFSGPGSSPKR